MTCTVEVSTVSKMIMLFVLLGMVVIGTIFAQGMFTSSDAQRNVTTEQEIKDYNATNTIITTTFSWVPIVVVVAILVIIIVVLMTRFF